MVSLIQRPASLTEIALQQIRTEIIEGTLPLGSTISEGQLAASLGISKTPVREALAQLRMEGLVTIVPQSGTFVFTLSATEVVEICELRQTLEAAALRLALERNRSRLIERLAEVCVGMDRVRAAGDEPAYLRLDSAFHEQFFANCGNRYFADAYARIVPKVAALRTHLATGPITRACPTKSTSRSCMLSSASATKSSFQSSTSTLNGYARPIHGISRTSPRLTGLRWARRDFRHSGRGDD